MIKNRGVILAATAIAPAVWGSTYLVTTELLPPERPLLAAVLRALPAGLLLIVIARRLPAGSWWWRSAILGTLNIGAFFALLFIAAYRLPGGVAATVGAIQPLLVGALAAWILKERLRTGVVISAAAGIAGVGLLVLRADARLDALGVVAAVGGAAIMATGVILSKKWVSPAPVIATTGWQLTAGGLALVPIMLFAEGTPPALTGVNLMGYAYLTLIGSAIAYVLWFRGIKALSPTEVTFLGFLSPLTATVAGWLVLDEHLTAWQFLGAAIVLAAITIPSLSHARRAPHPIERPLVTNRSE